MYFKFIVILSDNLEQKLCQGLAILNH